MDKEGETVGLYIALGALIVCVAWLVFAVWIFSDVNPRREERWNR